MRNATYTPGACTIIMAARPRLFTAPVMSLGSHPLKMVVSTVNRRMVSLIGLRLHFLRMSVPESVPVALAIWSAKPLWSTDVPMYILLSVPGWRTTARYDHEFDLFWNVGTSPLNKTAGGREVILSSALVFRRLP